MSRAFNVALAGATGLVGETLVDLLEERQFPVGVFFVLASEEASAEPVYFNGERARAFALESFDFSQADLAFFAVDSEVARAHAARAADAGCVVIDTSVCFRFDERVPLVVPELNPLALTEFRERNLIASPASATVALALALAPVSSLAGLARVNVSAYQPVSAEGRAGVEELARQTAELLNGRDASVERFGKQIAFNTHARVGDVADNGYTRDELALVLETRRLLGDANLPVNATFVRVPTFYGEGLSVQLETRDAVDAGTVREALARTAGVRVFDEAVPGGHATALTEAVGSDDIFISRIRGDISHSCGISFWVVADNVRKGAALNAVQIAELLIKDYM
jgi:aspartate-semialdehyde dehydrogenase